MFTPWLIFSQLSVATTFNGKGHVELRPPRNLKDISAFTAVDLLINRHQNNPPKAVYKRKQRQDKRRDASFFVFYLGNKDVSLPSSSKKMTYDFSNTYLLFRFSYHALLSFSGFWRLHWDGYQKLSLDLRLQVGGSYPWGGNQPNNNNQCTLLLLWQGYFPQVHTEN